MVNIDFKNDLIVTFVLTASTQACNAGHSGVSVVAIDVDVDGCSVVDMLVLVGVVDDVDCFVIVVVVVVVPMVVDEDVVADDDVTDDADVVLPDVVFVAIAVVDVDGLLVPVVVVVVVVVDVAAAVVDVVAVVAKLVGKTGVAAAGKNSKQPGV
jgi:hypothetical protein